MSLADIKERGTTRGRYEPTGVKNDLKCNDGFTVSVIAGPGAYCDPRPGWFGSAPEDYTGPYTHAEVGFPSERPEPWSEWEQYCEQPDAPTDTVYGHVPFELIEALLASHGGEVSS